MSEDRIYLDYLYDILDALRKSREFVAGMSMRQFSEDDKTAYAVVEKAAARAVVRPSLLSCVGSDLDLEFGRAAEALRSAV